MAHLNIIFTSKGPAGSSGLVLEKGDMYVAERLLIGETSARSTNASDDAHFIADILADADCWVAMAATPTAVTGSCRKLLAGERAQYVVPAGTKIAVVEDDIST